MSKPQSPCSKCQGAMSEKLLDPFEGEEAGLKLTIRSMPAVVCDQGHKRFVYPEFAALLMDFMMEPENFKFIPGAVKKGLFKKRFHCPGCDKELPESPTGSQTREVPVEIRKAEPFKVQFDVPVFKCGGCGKESIRTEETAQLAFKAIGHAYRATDIHPK